LHVAAPLAVKETASEGYELEGASSQTAGFKTAVEGERSNVPVAVNCTTPLGKLEAVAAAGVTAVEIR
jgi:hypothetical protein